MSQLSYRSPKTEVRPSRIEGRGLFAKAQIRVGEVVAVKGGRILTQKALAPVRELLGAAEIQIAEDLFIGPDGVEERDGSMIFSNHSCEPNIGLSGQIVFVAMRDIEADEELTHDWAMTDDDDDQMQCACGAVRCRGLVTGKDWQRPDLQARYGSYFSSYLLKKIQRLQAGG